MKKINQGDWTIYKIPHTQQDEVLRSLEKELGNGIKGECVLDFTGLEHSETRFFRNLKSIMNRYGVRQIRLLNPAPAIERLLASAEMGDLCRIERLFPLAW